MFVGDHSWCTWLEFSEFSAVFEFGWFFRVAVFFVACLFVEFHEKMLVRRAFAADLPEWKCGLFCQKRYHIFHTSFDILKYLFYIRLIYNIVFVQHMRLLTFTDVYLCNRQMFNTSSCTVSTVNLLFPQCNEPTPLKYHYNRRIS